MNEQDKTTAGSRPSADQEEKLQASALETQHTDDLYGARVFNGGSRGKFPEPVCKEQ